MKHVLLTQTQNVRKFSAKCTVTVVTVQCLGIQLIGGCSFAILLLVTLYTFNLSQIPSHCLEKL